MAHTDIATYRLNQPRRRIQWTSTILRQNAHQCTVLQQSVPKERINSFGGSTCTELEPVKWVHHSPVALSFTFTVLYCICMRTRWGMYGQISLLRGKMNLYLARLVTEEDWLMPRMIWRTSFDFICQWNSFFSQFSHIRSLKFVLQKILGIHWSLSVNKRSSMIYTDLN